MRAAEGRKETKREHRGLLGLIGVALLRDTARATAKSVAGIGVPNILKRTTRASVFFYVRPSCTRNFSYGGLGRGPSGRRFP
ncbi:ash family protein [Aeromonas caviae]|uniref:ash family protein n=1 Tax=Aeromonas caviae TaxID=648 RepID=UPI0039A6EFB1